MKCFNEYGHVTGEEVQLEVVRFAGKGGNATVWEVLVLSHSKRQVKTAADRGWRGFDTIPERVALKLSLRHCELKPEDQLEITEAHAAAAGRAVMALEYQVMRDSGGYGSVVNGYDWGSVAGAGGVELHGLLMELSPLGSLDALLVKDGQPCGLDATTTRHLVCQAAHGLPQLHEQGRAVHRDVKPSNLLLFGSSLELATCKLADFGSCHVCAGADDAHTSAKAGTAAYAAPEQVQGLTYDARVDTWQLGLLVLVLRTGMLPFWYLKAQCEDSAAEQARRCPEELDNPSSPYCNLLKKRERNFVKQCLVVNQLSRPTVTALCRDSFYLL
jgi:serine/threonine protein kinase